MGTINCPFELVLTEGSTKEKLWKRCIWVWHTLLCDFHLGTSGSLMISENLAQIGVCLERSPKASAQIGVSQFDWIQPEGQKKFWDLIFVRVISWDLKQELIN